MLFRSFRYADGAAPNLAALSAILFGYPLGIILLTQSFWLLQVLGVALVTIALIWSAYFIHEFSHLSIFKTANANRRWGTLMSWINGSCYASFDAMRKKHMRHHVERADVISFDVQNFFRHAPAWLRQLVLALEWAYFPAVEFLMRGFVIALPFTRKDSTRARLRIVGIFTLRTTAFSLLAWVSPMAVVLYFAAYLVFVTVLRFADCFQHTYDAYSILDDTLVPNDKLRDKAYEQANTYSDIVGLDSRWLNMLWLNFGFHNAHHEKPAMSWHRLPAYHRELYDERYAQVITVGELLKSFHCNRVRRVLSADYGQVLPPQAAGRADGFVGVVGVSFLTAV